MATLKVDTITSDTLPTVSLTDGLVVSGVTTMSTDVNVTSGRLLIGHTASIGEDRYLQLVGTSGDTASMQIVRHSANSSCSQIDFTKSRNATKGSNTVVNDNDHLGQICFRGDDGTDLNSMAASIIATVDGTPGSNDMPGRLSLQTTADGASTPTERLRITKTGRVKIGTGAIGLTNSMTAQGGLQVSTNGASGAPTVCFGADGTAANTQTITNDTIKDCRIGFPNYDISEEPLALMCGFVGDGSNADDNNSARLYIGGGTSWMNAVNNLRFFTASNLTTTTGTERLRIDSSGMSGFWTTTPRATLHVKAHDNSWESGLLLEDNTGSDGWNLHPESSDGSLMIGYNDDTTASLTSQTATTIIRLRGGGGICFGTDSAAANALDDYEEGNYSPTVQGSTGGSWTLDGAYNQLAYTKIGRMVTVTGRIRITGENSPSGTMVHVSLPTTSASLGEDRGRVTGSCTVQYADTAVNTFAIHPTAEGNSYVQIGLASGTSFGDAVSEFGGNELIGINVSYQSA